MYFISFCASKRESRASQLLSGGLCGAEESGKPDWIGAFAVTGGIGEEAIAKAYKADHDDYNAILIRAVCDHCRGLRRIPPRACTGASAPGRWPATKSLSSWVCPVGTLSEGVHLAGARKQNAARMPKPPDLALCSIKYLVSPFSCQRFAECPSRSCAPSSTVPITDSATSKMYDVSQPSAVTAGVVAVLGLLSLFYKGFVCRTLCPYGAPLGLASVISPTAVRRDAARCSRCGACSRACPSGLDVHASADGAFARVYRLLRLRQRSASALAPCAWGCGFEKDHHPQGSAGLLTVAAILFAARARFAPWAIGRPIRRASSTAVMPRRSGRDGSPALERCATQRAKASAIAAGNQDPCRRPMRRCRRRCLFA